MAEKREDQKAPPLTLDTVFEAVKRVRDWRKLGDRLLGNTSKLNAIQRQFDSDEARLKAMLEPFVLGKCSTYPAWRSVIDALHWVDEIAVAHDILTYAEAIQDPTMTVENVSKVLNKIEGDRWRVMDILDIPRPLREEIQRRYSTDAPQIHACADYFVNCHPNASWRFLTLRLHSRAELAAARESKSFMSTGDPSLTVDNVRCVIAKVEPNQREQVWESMTDYHDSIFDKIRNEYSSDLERETAFIDSFVNCNPRSSWENLIEALYKHQQEAALEEVKAYYLPPQDEPEF